MKEAALYVVLMLIWFLINVPSQAATSQTAPVGKFSGIDEIVEQCTNTTSFATIPQMTRTFTLGGTTNDEVVVMFKDHSPLMTLAVSLIPVLFGFKSMALSKGLVRYP